MAATLEVPRTELKRIADANRRILELADRLVALPLEYRDGGRQLEAELYDIHNDLVDAAKAINVALRSAISFADAA